MSKLLKKLFLCTVIALLLSCGAGKLSEKLPADLQTSFDWIKENKLILEQKREELATLSEQIDNYKPIEVTVTEGEGEEATEAPATLEELNTKLGDLKKEVSNLTNDFQTKLQDFLYALDSELANVRKSNPNVNMRKEHKEANMFFTDETITVCTEWVEKQGDFKKAIETMEETLANDPDNKAARDFLDKLKVDQFMTPEKLALVQRGMKEFEVAKTIGMVYRNFKESWPEQGTMAWFYPREDTGVAGVYFIKGSDDVYSVFKINYDAKKPKGEEVEEVTE